MMTTLESGLNEGFNLPDPLERFTLSKILGDIALPHKNTKESTETRPCFVNVEDFVKAKKTLFKNLPVQQLKRITFTQGPKGIITPKQNIISDKSPELDIPLTSLQPSPQTNTIANKGPTVDLTQNDPKKAKEMTNQKILVTPPNQDQNKPAARERKKEPAFEVITMSSHDIWEKVENLMSHEERSLSARNKFHISKMIKFLTLLGYDLSKQYELSFQSKQPLSHKTKLTVNYLHKNFKALNRRHTINRRYRCTQCDFKSESKIICDDHQRKPHLVKATLMDEESFTLIATYTLRCPYCLYRNRKSHLMRDHTEKCHKILIPYFDGPPRFYACNLCLYEVDKEVNLVHHMEKCKARYDPKNVLSLARMYNSYFPISAVDSSLIFTGPRYAAAALDAANAHTTTAHTPDTKNQYTAPNSLSSVFSNPTNQTTPISTVHNKEPAPNVTPFKAFTHIRPPASYLSKFNSTTNSPLSALMASQTNGVAFLGSKHLTAINGAHEGIPSSKGQNSRNLLHKYMAMLNNLTPSPPTPPAPITPATSKASIDITTTLHNTDDKPTPQVLAKPQGLLNLTIGLNIRGDKSKYQILVDANSRLTDPQKKGIINSIMNSLTHVPKTTNITTPSITSAIPSNCILPSSLVSLGSLISSIGQNDSPKAPIYPYATTLNGMVNNNVDRQGKLKTGTIIYPQSQASAIQCLAEIVNRADQKNNQGHKHVNGGSSSNLDSDRDSEWRANKRGNLDNNVQPRIPPKRARQSSGDSDGEISILGEYKNMEVTKTPTKDVRGHKDGPEAAKKLIVTSVDSKSIVKRDLTFAEASSPRREEISCEICDKVFDHCKPLDGHTSAEKDIIDHYELEHNIRVCPKTSTWPNKKVILPIPPLNCRKCQTRYYTLNGLERHLAITHDIILPDIAGIMSRSTNRGPKFCIWCSNNEGEGVGPNNNHQESGVVIDMVQHLSDAHDIDLRIRASPKYFCFRCPSDGGPSVSFECYETLAKHTLQTHNIVLTPHTNTTSGSSLQEASLTPTNLARPYTAAKASDAVSYLSRLNLQQRQNLPSPSTQNFAGSLEHATKYPCPFCPSNRNNLDSLHHNAGAFMYHILTDHAALLTPGLTRLIMESNSPAESPKGAPPTGTEDVSSYFLNHIPNIIRTLYNQCSLAASTLTAAVSKGKEGLLLNDQGFMTTFRHHLKTAEKGGTFINKDLLRVTDIIDVDNDDCSSHNYPSLPVLKPIYPSLADAHFYCA